MIDDLSVPEMRTRKTWLAVILSFAGYGIPQIYNRQYLKAAIIFLGTLAFLGTIGALHLCNTFSGLAFSLVAIVAIFVYTMIDGIRNARKPLPPADNTQKALQVCAILVFSTISIFLQPRKWIGMNAYSIPTSSNKPTLLEKDLVMASKVDGTDPAQVQRGDMIIFFRNNAYRTYRVIGMPGDDIRLAYHQVYINNQLVPAKELSKTDDPEEAGPTITLEETLPGTKPHQIYQFDQEDQDSTASNMHISVPSRSFWVMGDSRDNAADSRFEGPVPIDSITGIVRYVYYRSGKGISNIPVSRQ